MLASHTSSRNNVHRLDPPSIVFEEVVDKISEDPMGTTCAAIDDAAEQDGGVCMPLDVDGAPPVRKRAADLCPAVLAARLVFLLESEVEVRKLGVAGDRVA